jgi:prevent-host-death family protein
MKKASVRDLHIRTSELIREVAGGEVIVIERRGEPVAELRPFPPPPTKVKLPDMTRYWKSFPKVPADSGKYLEEDR